MTVLDLFTYIVGVSLAAAFKSLTVTQPLFAGFRTLNGAKIAEAAVLAGREVLRTTEQTTLLAAAQAFMDLVEAQATLNCRTSTFSSQQVKTAQDNTTRSSTTHKFATRGAACGPRTAASPG